MPLVSLFSLFFIFLVIQHKTHIRTFINLFDILQTIPNKFYITYFRPFTGIMYMYTFGNHYKPIAPAAWCYIWNAFNEVSIFILSTYIQRVAFIYPEKNYYFSHIFYFFFVNKLELDKKKVKLKCLVYLGTRYHVSEIFIYTNLFYSYFFCVVQILPALYHTASIWLTLALAVQR